MYPNGKIGRQDVESHAKEESKEKKKMTHKQLFKV